MFTRTIVSCNPQGLAKSCSSCMQPVITFSNSLFCNGLIQRLDNSQISSRTVSTDQTDESVISKWGQLILREALISPAHTYTHTQIVTTQMGKPLVKDMTVRLPRKARLSHVNTGCLVSAFMQMILDVGIWDQFHRGERN